MVQNPTQEAKSIIRATYDTKWVDLIKVGSQAYHNTNVDVYQSPSRASSGAASGAYP